MVGDRSCNFLRRKKLHDLWVMDSPKGRGLRLALRSFADAGLGQLLTMIKTKAKVHGRKFVRVQPHYTSQDCPQCGHRAKKSLSTRIHLCGECGYQEQRDVAAAINIRNKANF